MSRSAEVWREHLGLWLPALVFCLVNLAVFSTYRLAFAGQDQLRKKRLARLQAEQAELETRHATLDGLVKRATATRESIGELYSEWLTPERQRLTRVIAEVKELARRAGLEPTVIAYPEEELEEFGLLKRSIVFTVEGNYAALRRLVNFLELTESFLILEEVRLAEGGRTQTVLRINLKLFTLFPTESDRVPPAPGAES